MLPELIDVPGDAVRREDPRSFVIERLIRAWARTIRAAAARYGIAGGDLDEIAQDVRVRLWRALERHGHAESDLTAAYAYRAAASAAVDMLRRRRAEQRPGRTAFEEAEAVIAGPGIDPADEAEILRKLEVALEKVPVSRRPAVRLHLDGHHLSDIARLLGWTPASARNRLYRGLDDLRSALRDDDAADNGT
jgi:RNA polymerase sigma factor (sigma-70 family)